MELREIVLVIWKRLWLIILGTVLFAALVFVVSLRIKPVYEARVLMALEHTNSAFSSEYGSLVNEGNLALTYSTLIKTRPIMEIVIGNLNLDISPEHLSEEMLAVELVEGTQLLKLTVQDTDPQRASNIANEIAYTFISLNDTEQKLQNIKELEKDVVSQMAILKELIARNQSTIPSTTTGLFTDQELALAQSTLSNQQLAYVRLMEIYLNIRLTQGQLLYVRVVEPAVPPQDPIRPNVPLYTFLGACIGLTFCIGMAFFVEYLDRSVKTADDVQQRLSVPTLGSIYRLRNKRPNYGLITLTLPASATSEAYRMLRTNLHFASFDMPLRTLLITSARVGEGKTSVAANLGIVHAQAGLKVLLIDSDLRRPHLHQVFKVPNHLGLTDFLVGNVEHVEDCTLQTGIDNLQIIPCGTVPSNPSELLASEKMTAALEEAGRAADLIIIDAPPTLLISDPLILAAKVDGVLLTIEANKTTYETVRRAYEALKQVGPRVLGAVVTKVKLNSGDAYKYYTQQPARSDIRNNSKKVKTGPRASTDAPQPDSAKINNL